MIRSGGPPGRSRAAVFVQRVPSQNPLSAGTGDFEKKGTESVPSSEKRSYSPRQRNRKVTIWARVQLLLGLKVVALVPPVMPFSAAQTTALA